jgi:hypothetical protein
MRILAAVNTIFAAALLLFGAFAIAGFGITALFLLIPGFILAFIAAVTWQRSRAAVLLALTTDALMSYLAVPKFLETLNDFTGYFFSKQGQTISAGSDTIEQLLSILTLILVATGFIAVLIDWRSVRTTKWF